MSDSQKPPNNDDTLKLPDPSIDEHVARLIQQVAAISKELEVHPSRVSMDMKRRADGQVEVVLTFPPDVTDRIERRSKLKLAGQDAVILGGIEVQFGDERPQNTAGEPEFRKPSLKLWTGDERKRRSKPKGDGTPRLPG